MRDRGEDPLACAGKEAARNTPPTAPKTSPSATTERRTVSNGTFSLAHSDMLDGTVAIHKRMPVPSAPEAGCSPDAPVTTLTTRPANGRAFN